MLFEKLFSMSKKRFRCGSSMVLYWTVCGVCILGSSEKRSGSAVGMEPLLNIVRSVRTQMRNACWETGSGGKGIRVIRERSVYILDTLLCFLNKRGLSDKFVKDDK